MEALHWPLNILSKAVHYKNLTAASAHVGISQSQLSRIISQLERDLDVILLDRNAKRKSGWTPAAFRLAEIYSQNSRKLQSIIAETLESQAPTLIRIGTLEGLSEFALGVAHNLLDAAKIKTVEIDVYDQSELEEKFFNGDLDLIFTSRSPGKQKYKNLLELGYQTFETINSSPAFTVMSPFEFAKTKVKPVNKTLISNSLFVRRKWLEKFGGDGRLPSRVKKSQAKDASPVMIIGAESINNLLWTAVKNTEHKF